MTIEENTIKMKYIITEAVKKYGDRRIKLGMASVPRKSTGSVHYDYLLSGGFEAGTIAVYYGVSSSGKAQTLTSKILAPTGWIKMGDINKNDIIYDSTGKECKVTGVFPQGIKDVYRISFDDNTSTECCKEHLWASRTAHERSRNKKYVVRNLESMMDNYNDYSIPYNSIIPFTKNELLLHPYVLGALIGDGSFCKMIKFTNAETDVVNSVSAHLPVSDMLNKFEYNEFRLKRKQYNNHVSDTLSHIRTYGLDNKKSYEKFIPKDYLYSNVDDRVKLLQGLMDTDGFICKKGSVSYSTVSKQLAEDVCCLVRSLGGRAKMTTKNPTYTYKGVKHNGRLAYNVFMWFYNGIVPVTSDKHLSRYMPPRKMNHKHITNIEYIGKAEAQCIMIDSPSHLYITDDFIVTHNTTMALRNIAAAQRRGETCAWLRVEKGCNREYMERIGVDVDNLLILENLPYGEAYLDILLELIKEEVDMIVVDSISGLVAKREMEGSLEKEYPGLQAKLITRMLGQANAVNTKSNIIFISQIREQFNSMGYTKFNFAGGRAAEHYGDYIVEFKIKDRIDVNGKEVGSKTLKTEDRADIVGINMLMYTHKCRRGLAHKVGEMYFNFKTGMIDEIGELVRVATKLGEFDYSGGWMTLTDEFIEKWGIKSNKIRHNALKEIVVANEELQEWIKDRIKEHYDG